MATGVRRSRPHPYFCRPGERVFERRGSLGRGPHPSMPQARSVGSAKVSHVAISVERTVTQGGRANVTSDAKSMP